MVAAEVVLAELALHGTWVLTNGAWIISSIAMETETDDCTLARRLLSDPIAKSAMVHSFRKIY